MCNKILEGEIFRDARRFEPDANRALTAINQGSQAIGTAIAIDPRDDNLTPKMTPGEMCC